MFEKGIINNRGKFDRDLPSPHIRKKNNVYEYVLAWAEDTQITRDISITENDIDNLIRAKGAIFSGCASLMDEVGISIKDIDDIIIAGGFGSCINLEKAMAIGLLPERDVTTFSFII